MTENTTDTSSTWRYILETSADQFRKGELSKKEASRLLWLGAVAAIKDWDPAVDPTGIRLYRDVLTVLGGTRASAASKVKTVALAVHHNDLDLRAYGALGPAYDAAYRLGLGEVSDPEPVCTCTCH